MSFRFVSYDLRLLPYPDGDDSEAELLLMHRCHAIKLLSTRTCVNTELIA